jgi:hypothetical protein
VAAKLAFEKYERQRVHLVYCDTLETEHPDNARFMKDVEAWLGVTVERIHSQDFQNIDEVFEKTRYMAGIGGARCTAEMKKVPRFQYQRWDDTHIFGYTAEEQSRMDRFEQANPELRVDWLLLEHGMTKQRCLEEVESAGIKLPVMYSLGYNHNNCLGCVKATSARYWNMVRRDFPDVFERRARQSREIGCRLTRYKGERIFLDELPPDYLPPEPLEDISCGPDCQLTFL